MNDSRNKNTCFYDWCLSLKECAACVKYGVKVGRNERAFFLSIYFETRISCTVIYIHAETAQRRIASTFP